MRNNSFYPSMHVKYKLNQDIASKNSFHQFVLKNKKAALFRLLLYL